LRELSLLIPRLTLFLGGGVSLPVIVEIEGRAISIEENSYRLEADPGLYELSLVDARGNRITTQWAARIAERSESLTVRFPSVRPAEGEPSQVIPRTDLDWEAPERPLPYGAIAALSASGAAFVGAGVFAAMAFGTARSIKKNCEGSSCLPEDRPRAERARRYANVATAGVVVSAVGGATGISLLLFETRADASVGMSLAARLDGIELQGRF
jgi:hypothetical protein